MAQIGRVNWVTCPNCSWRYYLGPQVLLAEGTPCICPKCRLEYDPRPHLDRKLTDVTAADLH